MTPCADPPVWVRAIGQWVVSVHYSYAPGEPVTRVHATYSFDTEQEALGFVAHTNGKRQ